MKYNNIATTLGWAEVPETEEGLFLQPEELTAVDKALAPKEDKTAELTAENTRLQTELTAMTSGQAETQRQLDASNARITTLEAENKKLGGQSSGTGTTVTTTEDETVKEKTNGKVSLNDPEHPLNKYASSKIGAKKKVAK